MKADEETDSPKFDKEVKQEAQEPLDEDKEFKPTIKVDKIPINNQKLSLYFCSNSLNIFSILF